MAKMFQVSLGDAGFSFNSVNYNFSDFDTIDYTYNKKNRLTRGANATNKEGIVYSEGLKVADIAQVKVVDCSIAIYNLLLSIYENKDRINFWFIDRKTGEGYTMKSSIITDKPRQTQISETEDSIGFMFNVESYDMVEKLNDE